MSADIYCSSCISDENEKSEKFENDENMNPVKRLKFPFEINEVSDKENAKLLEDFSGERTCFVQVGQKKWFFPGKYKKEAENFYNFEVRKDDVWIVTFPRSGTTWTQEMVWLIANNLDYQKAADIPLVERSPFLEFSVFMHDELKETFKKENSFSEERVKLIEEIATPGWKTLSNYKGKRIIKTHFPFSLLPPNLLTSGCKVIYVARNPKDVAVSFYHLNKLFRTQGYSGDFPKYWNYFERNLQPWTPYFEHIKEGWERRHESNLLFMFYEDMNKDLTGAIRKMSNFLEKDMTEQDINVLKNHLKIENFRLNSSVNMDVLSELGICVNSKHGFVRKGKSGSWKEMFDEELNKKADKWIADNLENTDIIFPV